MEKVKLTGHPIAGYSDGFTIVGCWMRLARGCLRDMFETYQLPGAHDRSFWQRTALIAVTPPPNSERFDDEEGDGEVGIVQAFFDPLLATLPMPLDLTRSQVVAAGHAGTAIALKRTVELLLQRECERVIIVAVDSYLDPLTLDWLIGHGRLKYEGNPVGLVPGECGACFLVESLRGAEGRHAPVRAHVVAVSVGRETDLPLKEGPVRGRALSGSIRDVLAHARQPFVGEIFSDLNGEDWRAHQWGSAVVALGTTLGSVRLRLPAVSIGDTGAASGALGICSAVHSFARNATASHRALVVSTSEGGEVGAVAMRGPHTTEATP
jgi:3-oxoacyl-[acyl-carrier-protein] synthase-1